MDYILTFLEGIISVISPCMLPMLPIYISYFAGNSKEKKNVLKKSIYFVAGFTIIFCILGLFAGAVGGLLSEYKTAVNIVCGTIIIIFGLSFLEIIKIPFFKGINSNHTINNSFSAFVFGIIFSVNLTPCIGTFLGSALMMASASGEWVKGVAMLLCYSLGIGIPFILSALIIDKLNSLFSSIKKHYTVINNVCGIFLIIVGISILFGWLNKLLSLFS